MAAWIDDNRIEIDLANRRFLEQQATDGGNLPSLAGPGGVPGVFSDYFKLLTDLMVLAWQTDMTRVITFQMGHEMSGRAYPEIGFGDSHHSVTHTGLLPASFRRAPQRSPRGS